MEYISINMTVLQLHEPTVKSLHFTMQGDTCDPARASLRHVLYTGPMPPVNWPTVFIARK